MTVSPDQAPQSGGDTAIEWEDPSVLPIEGVRDVFITLTKALRAFQLYDSNNPVYKRFVAGLEDAFRELWETRDSLEILVDETQLTWMGEVIYTNPNRADSLAFVFYRDGIRELTFHKGVEDGELERVLGALHQAKNVRGEGDDLVTILWDQDLTHVTYGAVDVLGDGLEIPGPSEGVPFDPRKVLEGENLTPPEADEDEGEEEEGEHQEEDGSPSQSVSKEDFNPTLYALDASEREYLKEELAKELARDLRNGVLTALLDRLEEQKREGRQEEILGILRTLLPNFLSRGALAPAAQVMEELDGMRKRSGLLSEPARELAEALFDDLSSQESVSEIVRAIEDGSFPPDARELRALLRFLRVEALGPLLKGAERAQTRDAQRLLREATHGIAEANRGAVIDLLSSPDSTILFGAIRMVGQLGLAEAAPQLARLLEHADPEVRRIVVETAEKVPSSVLAGALQRVLHDPDRELALIAVRALGASRYAPAAAEIQKLLQSREVRSAEIEAKLTYFEAYALTAGEDAIPYLDRILNGKGFLGRREPSDLRACAALSLGRIGTEEASEVLERAREEGDAVVRSAVNRALRGELRTDG